MFKSSIQRELDRFFKAVSKNDFNIREVTKGAFTQARAKLDPWAFQRLNEIAVDTFYDHAEYYVWHEKRLLAVDGTRLVLPKHGSIIEEFEEHGFGPNAESPRSIASCSLLYDVLNQIALDGQLASYGTNERDLLVKHLDKVNPGDLLVLDRGYPSFWLFFLLKAKKIDFCVRLQQTWWLAAKDLANSDDKEHIITIKLPKKDKDRLADYPEIQNETLTCRLINVELANGEIEILCTSLLDSEIYKNEEFAELYHYRWNEEEAFKLLKNRIELENFSGKTLRAIKQDIYAKIFLITLCASFAHPIEEKVNREYKADKDRKFNQKINRSNALAMTRDLMIGLFIRKRSNKALDSFDKITEGTREIIRPGRKLPRKHLRKKPYCMNYKPL